MIVVKIGMFALGPFLGFGEQRVAHFVVGIVLEGNARSWIPLGVLLAEAFLGVSSQFQFLTLTQLDDKNLFGLLSIFVFVFIAMVCCHWLNFLVAGIQVCCGHQTGLLVSAFNIQRELDAAVLTEINTHAVSAVQQALDNVIRNQWDQSDSVGYKQAEVNTNKLQKARQKTHR